MQIQHPSVPVWKTDSPSDGWMDTRQFPVKGKFRQYLLKQKAES